MTHTQSPIQLNATINPNNQRRLSTLIDNIFKDYSKLLTVRVDFYLKNDFDEIHTYEYMNQAFERLRNNLRFNRIFEHYITYAAKLEYGEDRKWHYHVLFFFDGQYVKNDYLLAKAIGEYWVSTITQYTGAYHSPNMNVSNYHTFAMGMIQYHEAQKIENLKAAGSYLAKETVLSPNEPMFDAAGKRYRSYRQGEYKPKNSLSGRPRLHTPTAPVSH